MTVRRHRRYSTEFKIQLVQAYLDGEGSVRKIATRHGVPHSLLAIWIRKYLDRPDRLACFSVEGVEKGLLCGLEHARDALAIDGDIHQDRRRGHVVVPDVVMDRSLRRAR